ncbi:MAG: hypothetical protein ACKOV8_05090, partial [Phycisphaerales bacterium]
IPHGPHPGTVEKSIGARETTELAVMCDTFRPMFPTKAAMEFDDLAYPRSWEGEHFPVSLEHGTPNGGHRANGHAGRNGATKPAGKKKAKAPAARRGSPLSSTWE